MKISLEVTRSRSSRWNSFVRAAKKHSSFVYKPGEPEAIALTFTDVAEVNSYLITCMNWNGVTLYLNDQKITPQQAWDLCNDVVSLREQGCPEQLIEESLKQGAARKNYVRAAMEQISAMLAAELGLPAERVQVERRLNMPPYFQNEEERRIAFPEKGPLLTLGVVNSPTLWQIDLLSRDVSANIIARQVRSALQAVAWQLDKPTTGGPLIEVIGLKIPLGIPVPQPSGRLRISDIQGPIDGSGHERGLRRYIFSLVVELPAIDSEKSDDLKPITQERKKPGRLK